MITKAKTKKGRAAQTAGPSEQAILSLTTPRGMPARQNKKPSSAARLTPSRFVPTASNKTHAAMSLLPTPGPMPRATSTGPAKVLSSPQQRVSAPISQRAPAGRSLPPQQLPPGRDKPSGDQHASAADMATPEHGRDHSDHDTQTAVVSAICRDLRELQSQRRSVMVGAQRLLQSRGAYVRRALGWSKALPDKERARITKRAAAIVSAIVKDKVRDLITDPWELVVVNHAHDLVLVFNAGIAPLAKRRLDIEKSMTRLAMSLPLTAFVDGIVGFGYFGLAVIVGEAGDLGLYGNPAKLWKRMGVAVFQGKSQRRTSDAEDAVLQGYNPKRRSALWTLGDSLLKAKNVYKDAYDTRKLYVASDEHKAVATVEIKSKMHAHRQAQRYAEKLLLKHLWKAWRVAMKLPDAGGWEQHNGVGRSAGDTLRSGADGDVNSIGGGRRRLSDAPRVRATASTVNDDRSLCRGDAQLHCAAVVRSSSDDSHVWPVTPALDAVVASPKRRNVALKKEVA